MTRGRAERDELAHGTGHGVVQLQVAVLVTRCRFMSRLRWGHDRLPAFGVIRHRGPTRRKPGPPGDSPPRPVSPRPSVVVADTDTGAPADQSSRCASLAGVRPSADCRSPVRPHLPSGSRRRRQVPDVVEHRWARGTPPLRIVDPNTVPRSPARRPTAARRRAHGRRRRRRNARRSRRRPSNNSPEQSARPSGSMGCTSVPDRSGAAADHALSTARASVQVQRRGDLEGQRVPVDHMDPGPRCSRPAMRRR